MVNTKKIIKGTVSFLIGFLIMYIMNEIIAPMLESLEGIFSSNTDLQGIIWFFTILLWITISVIIPSFLIITGLKEEKESTQGGEITLGIIIFITSIILTIKGWFWITTFASLAGTGLIAVIFWTGLILIWSEVTIITPIYLIIKNTRQWKMTTKYIWAKNQRYYLYELFNNYQNAVKTAKWYQKRNKKNKYIIIKIESGGFWSPKTKYALYMNKTVKIF